jgi:hypothetical protein
MAELWLLISAPPIGPRSNSSISPTPSPLKMCDLDSIPLAEHYWPAALTRRGGQRHNGNCCPLILG